MDRAFAPLRTKRNSMGQDIWFAGSLFPYGLFINLKAKLSQSGHKPLSALDSGTGLSVDYTKQCDYPISRDLEEKKKKKLA